MHSSAIFSLTVKRVNAQLKARVDAELEAQWAQVRADMLQRAGDYYRTFASV